MKKSQDKLIIVEGKTDKQRLLPLIDEPVEILCTHGTLSMEKLEEWLEHLETKDVYILVDADEAGNHLRNQLEQELPNATHLYTKRMYREVARTPVEELLRVLENAHFRVKEEERTAASYRNFNFLPPAGRGPNG